MPRMVKSLNALWLLHKLLWAGKTYWFALLCVSFFSSLPVTLPAQTKRVFQEEMERYLATTKVEGAIAPPYTFLRDSLPDGHYEVYDLSIADSSRRSLKSYLLMSGSYTNGVRHGAFHAYTKCRRSNRMNQHTLVSSYNFAAGKLDGHMVESNCSWKVIEGHFSMGKRDGLFLHYDPKSGSLVRVEYYEDDRLAFITQQTDLTKVIPADSLRQYHYLGNKP